jgi:hypothetical protein
MQIDDLTDKKVKVYTTFTDSTFPRSELEGTLADMTDKKVLVECVNQHILIPFDVIKYLIFPYSASDTLTTNIHDIRDKVEKMLSNDDDEEYTTRVELGDIDIYYDGSYVISIHTKKKQITVEDDDHSELAENIANKLKFRVVDE